MDGDRTPSAIDRIVALADQCVLCGLCLPHCPTYRLDRIEAESPRGRIMQFRGLALGEIEATDAAQAHLDHCLACRNCETVCPARVRYGELLVEGRALLRTQRPASTTQRALEWLFARPGRLSLLAATGGVLARRLPAGLRDRMPLLQRGAALHRARRWPPVTPARGTQRGRVGLLLGCVGRHAQGDAIEAALKVLSWLGWEVRIPAAQGCCGALARHAGRPEEGDRLAGLNARAFGGGDGDSRGDSDSDSRGGSRGGSGSGSGGDGDGDGDDSGHHGVERLLVLDSGCVESQQHGSGALPVEELLAFVARDPRLAGLRAPPALAATPVALHLPCTQRNVTGNAATVRALMEQLGFSVVVVGAEGCCGAAGSHMLLEPARADALRQPLLGAIAASGAATLATGNVGCRLHLAGGRGAPPTVHPIELIAQCLD